MASSHQFSDLTLLITHYNRSSSLERLLSRFDHLQCRFADIVVSDDGSKPEHLEKVRALQASFPFRLVTTPSNAGLGNNINKGQRAVTTPYTLYVQEDFVPQEDFLPHLLDAIAIMNERADFDLIRFYSYTLYPALKPYGKGFSEMIFKFWQPSEVKVYAYSDHPHLRRRNFLEKFGPYAEGKSVENTEYRMCISFLQKKGKGLFYDKFLDLFTQLNSNNEPSTVERNVWRKSNNVLIRPARSLYRFLKFNYHYFFQGPQ